MKSLIFEIESLTDFQKKYGAIVSLMKLKMKEVILTTLVQFHDLLYWCFTFPDYQLMPIVIGGNRTDCLKLVREMSR